MNSKNVNKQNKFRKFVSEVTSLVVVLVLTFPAFAQSNPNVAEELSNAFAKTAKIQI